MRTHLENLALGSLGAHVSHKAAQVAQDSSKLSPRGAQTAQNWIPRGNQNPQNLTFEHQGMGTKNEPAKGCPQPSKCKPLSLKNGAQTTDKKIQIGLELRKMVQPNKAHETAWRNARSD